MQDSKTGFRTLGRRELPGRQRCSGTTSERVTLLSHYGFHSAPGLRCGSLMHVNSGAERRGMRGTVLCFSHTPHRLRNGTRNSTASLSLDVRRSATLGMLNTLATRARGFLRARAVVAAVPELEIQYREKESPARGGALELRLRGDYFRPSPLTSTSTRRFGCRHAISSFMFFWSHCTTGCFSPIPIVSIFALSTPLLTR